MNNLNKYKEYKDSGVNWIGLIPKHWEVKPLKYLCSLNDEVLPESTAPDVEINYVDIGSVNTTNGTMSSQLYTFEESPSRARRIVKDGDIIISTVRTYLKALARINKPENNLVVSTGFAVVRPEKINSMFLAYMLESKYFIEKVVSMSVGVSYPAITSSVLSGIDILVPPINEQIAISKYLNNIIGKIDILIEKKQVFIETLKEKRISIISDSVIKGIELNTELCFCGVPWLGEIPKHWEVKKLKYIFHNLDRKRIPLSGEDRAGLEKKYPYYGASGIIDYVDDYIFDEPLILVAEDGANLYSRSSPLAFIAVGKYWVNNHAHIIKPKFGNIRYWEFVLQLFDYTPLISGSAQPKLTAEKLGIINLPVPPESEQELILNHLIPKVEQIDNIILKTGKALDKLKEYKTALMTSAVTGNIKIKE